MNCQQAKPLIEPYADGELDAAGMVELEKHIQDCPACALEWRNLKALKKAVQQEAVFFTAPPELRRRVTAELHSQFDTGPRWSFWNWNWLTAASSSVAVACLAVLLTVTLSRPSAQQQLAREIVSSHIRSLMASHALDVISTDQHTVKPWFNGKLDFSPPVKDLAAQGFPLLGGRLDYLDGHTVAALIYQRHKHVLNLFIWPAKEKDSPPRARGALRGYNLMHWARGGMNFWLVSDLNEQEMESFAGMFAE